MVAPPKTYLTPQKHHIHQEGEQLLRVTVPVKVTALGFRLEKFLIYEVTKGGWAEAVGLKLGTLAIHKKRGRTGGRMKFGGLVTDGSPGILELFGYFCFVVWVSYNDFGAKRVLAGSFFEGVKVFFWKEEYEGFVFT